MSTLKVGWGRTGRFEEEGIMGGEIMGGEGVENKGGGVEPDVS